MEPEEGTPNEQSETPETTDSTNTEAEAEGTADAKPFSDTGSEETKGDSQDASDDAGEATEYEPFTLPEGMEITEGDLTAFNEIARSLNLDQEGAQAFIDLESKREAARVEAEDAATAEMHSEWQESLKNHETLGGDNHAATLASFDLLAPVLGESATAFLKETNLIFHPELAPFFALVGNSLKESPAALGNAGGTGAQSSPESRAKNMFANSNHV